MKRDELVFFLDDNFEDLGGEDAPNGLQFLGRDEINKVAFAVDARLSTIKKAVESGADMLFTHHPMIFTSIQRVGRMEKERLSALMKGDLNLYSQHLPLDKHPEWGNNVMIARALGLGKGRDFGFHHGFSIGLSCPTELTLDELLERVRKNVGECTVIKTGDYAGEVCILSGGGWRAVNEVPEGGTFITGDPNRVVEIHAKERGFNAIFAGHYNTEVFGVKAVAEVLSKKGLKTVFIDEPTLL